MYTVMMCQCLQLFINTFHVELLLGGAPVRMVNLGDLDGNGYNEMAFATPGMEGGRLDIYYGQEDFVNMRHVSVDYTTGFLFAISVASGDIDVTEI